MKMDALFEQDDLPAEESRRREIAKTMADIDCTIGSGWPRRAGVAA
jgi:hypothetical protein